MSMAYSLPGGDRFADSSMRIVSNDHPDHAGSFIEFSAEQITCTLEYRSKQLSPSTAYYVWMYPVGNPNIKVYHQLRKVWYAEYIPGMFYVNMMDLIPDGQLELL